MRVLSAVFWWMLVGLVGAQGLSDPGAKPLEAAKRALDAGRGDEAVHHLREVWAYRGGSAELAELWLRAVQGEDDVVRLWAHRLAGYLADDRGKGKFAGDVAKIIGKDKRIFALAQARADAVAELLKRAGTREKKGAKDPEELLVARWMRRLAADLAEGVPALEARGPEPTASDDWEFEPRLSVPRDAHAAWIDAMHAELVRAKSGGRTGDAIELARCLRGLGRQAGLKDLLGEAPDGMEAVERNASELLGEVRADLRKRAEPWTVAELEELLSKSSPDAPREQQEAFTRAHASMGTPAVALSPTGKYRIETECGFETLLGVARTIEHHHARLVHFYGRDPFEDRQGTVRIVPEAAGLEAEGAPFWWAGGFQAGDVTTVRFSIGDIEGLGHTLTHELTHRFDGALFPGQMGWLSEGKAVWTGAAYGGWVDEAFVPNHAIFGTIERAWIKGYGGLENLRKLIDGSLEEYRDNYFAGYALYVYLTTADDGVFAARWDEYLAGLFRGNRDPLAWFGRHFVDGEDGRPDSYEAFAERFQTWLGGFYWQDRKPWTDRYTRNVPDTREGGWVYDAPTWTWSRARAEPSFGQAQAAEGARLLAKHGRARDAADGFVWGLSQDGRTPMVERELAELYDALGEKEAAWVLRADLGIAGETPIKMPRTREYLELLAEVASEYAAEGLTDTASALVADHDRLAARLGLAPVGEDAAATVAELDAPAKPLFDPERLVEDGLTGYEELRSEGLWYAADDGTLHVGRRKPRDGTGTLDRRAHQRHAFVRSDEWIRPGRYVLSSQVQLTTSFVDAAIVLGYTRRDRNVRVKLNAGDFAYSIGVKDDAEEIKTISWRVDGLFDRDGALHGSRPGGRVDFGRPVSAIQVDLLVDGAAVHVIVDGERRGTYHTVDGAPIEGYVGFATSMGAIKVRKPTVRRLDRADWVERRRDRSNELFLNYAFRAGREAPTNGMLFLRMAQPDDEEEGYAFDPGHWQSRAMRAARTLVELLEKEDVRQPWAMAVSERLEGEPLEAIRAELRELLGREPDLFTVPVVAPPAEDDPDAREKEKDLDTNWLVLVDPVGVIRVRDDFFGFETKFTGEMRHWMTVLRENGFPERELPEVWRAAEEEEAEAESGSDGEGDGDGQTRGTASG